MSKRQKRNDLVTLAEWSEMMARHNLDMALGTEGITRQRYRALRFRARRHAQIATALRSSLGKPE